VFTGADIRYLQPRPSAPPVGRRAGRGGGPAAREIRELGDTGSANLLVRYLKQGRADTERASPPPRRLVSWIMTRPVDLAEPERGQLDDLLALCPHLTVLTEHVRTFAGLLTARRGADLEAWMTASRPLIFPRCRPSSAAYAQGHTRRHRRAEHALQQRPDRRRQHQGQTPQATDVRAGRLPPLRRRILLS
jgi:hypothetical protein